MVEENNNQQDVNSIQIGDILVTSTRNSLKGCLSTAKDILKDKEISKYLNCDYPKKRMSGL